MTKERKRNSIFERLTVSAITAVVAVFFAFLWMIAAHAKDNTAATMRIKKTEGTVKVAESTGKEVSILKDMKLKSGHKIDTEEKSYAWITLDDAKLLKMDAVSEAAVRKKGKKLEILLESGSLFFEVSEPLEDEEVLNIRTSTMAVGIRGTSGWVNIIDDTTVRISILEGKVEVCVADPLTGQVKMDYLSTGESAVCVVYGENRIGGVERCDILKEKYTKEDIDGFVLAEIVPDKELCEKIYAQGGVDLRDMTVEEAKERLRADEAVMQEKLKKITTLGKQQENNSASKAEWGERKAPDDADEPTKQKDPDPRKTRDDSDQSDDSDQTDDSDESEDSDDSDQSDDTEKDDTEQSDDTEKAESASPVLYTVVFDANGGENFLVGETVTLQTVPVGASLSEPTTAPTRTGYIFTGWYTDSSGTARYDFSTPVRGSFRLYAGWKIDDTISYQVIFNANGVGNPATQTMKGGSKVSKPSLSPWSGHVFQGWYTDAACTQVYDFNTPVVGNFTLYAGWKTDNNTYTVTFNPCGATYSGETTRTKNAGESLGGLPGGPTVPAGGTPSATNVYTFIGWYTTEQDGGERVTENTIVTGNMTVYARWNEWRYDAATQTLTIDIEGDMPDYSRNSSYNIAPWYSQRDAVGTIVLEEGITSIGNWAFADFSKLTNITLPQSVARIGIDAFYRCSSLQSIVIPEGITVISGGTFTGCSSLTNVTLPQSLRSINDANYYIIGGMGGYSYYDGAFAGCTSLTEIEIPGNVTYIGTQAFQNCSKLNSIAIPEGVTKIAGGTFAGCSSLTSVTLPQSLRSIDNAFWDWYTHIYRDGAFANCTSLTEMTIPEGVTYIGSEAFYGCSRLTKITLPVSVTNIANNAFSYCSNLRDVYFDGIDTEKKWSYNFGSNVTIHYKEAEPAAVFTSLEDGEAVSDNDVSSGDVSSDEVEEEPEETVSSGDVSSDNVEEEPEETVSGGEVTTTPTDTEDEAITAPTGGVDNEIPSSAPEDGGIEEPSTISEQGVEGQTAVIDNGCYL